jgi:hypothetical protein
MAGIADFSPLPEEVDAWCAAASGPDAEGPRPPPSVRGQRVDAVEGNSPGLLVEQAEQNGERGNRRLHAIPPEPERARSRRATLSAAGRAQC